MAEKYQDSGLCGVLLLDKPQTFTSFDAIAKLRGILQTRRLGHTGTLDPMATGLLVVLAGNATAAAELLPGEKSYIAGFQLGMESDTQDLTGNILKKSDAFNLPKEAVEEALKGFLGKIWQTPPMYSSVKVNGVRLYKLARQGKEIERPAREVAIYSLFLREYIPENGTGVLELTCSKGGYVRTLIHDLGQALGCGALMTSLRRTAACGFRLEDACDFQKLESAKADGQPLNAFFRPVESLFTHLPTLHLVYEHEAMYKNGYKLPLDWLDLPDCPDEALMSVYGKKFLGVARKSPEEGILRSVKNFYGSGNPGHVVQAVQ